EQRADPDISYRLIRNLRMNPRPITLKRSKAKFGHLSTAALVIAAAGCAFGQYAPPPPPQPFQCFINESLRKNDPYINNWDLGGSARLRFEDKEGFGIPGSPGSVDFRENNADVENAYFLEKIRLRAGYTDKWWSVLAEGQSSLAQDDDRWAYANNPKV